jgi:NAD(P)-dependent dehydrogenase (short-subunit alcohol dehydrogenase family)
MYQKNQSQIISSMKKKTWFVTGASKGLGLSLVKTLLAGGYPVAATSRAIGELQNAVGATSANFLPLSVNLLDEKSVATALDATLKQFGSIDVVVNNAGYGLAGALEELSDAEARANFDVNVFGALNVIRQALPHLRKQSSGHIFNVASVGGFTGGFPGFGIYCATKFAMHGFSESLAEEVKAFGIRVTIVSPGYFRTNFLDTSLSVPSHPIDDYKSVREAQSIHQNNYNGNQPGDPDKASAVIVQVAEGKDSLLHLFLGPDAYMFAEQKMHAVQKDMEAARAIATTTNF